MKTFVDRISDISFHLQSLAAPEISSRVQDAVERKDRNTLVELCRKAKIPRSYTSTVISVIMAVSPQQKWPSIY
jgi:hypothetical protein